MLIIFSLPMQLPQLRMHKLTVRGESGRVLTVLPAHPFTKVPTRNLLWMLLAFFGASLAISLVLHGWSQQLSHPGAPLGIVSFELAWSEAGLQQIIGPWNEETRAIALRLTLYDYIYLISYSTGLVIVCLLLGRWAIRRGRKGWAAFWRHAAWFPWIAAALDFIENTASLPLLLTAARTPWVQIMTAAAATKFLILGAILGLIWFCSVFLLLMPRRRS